MLVLLRDDPDSACVRFKYRFEEGLAEVIPDVTGRVRIQALPPVAVIVVIGSRAEPVLQSSRGNLKACERLRTRRRPGTAVASRNAMTRKMITNSITAKTF
jgi:hypothetical protein